MVNSRPSQNKTKKNKDRQNKKIKTIYNYLKMMDK